MQEKTVTTPEKKYAKTGDGFYVERSENMAGVPPTTESSADFLARMSDSGMEWAEEFCATAEKLGYSKMDIGWVCGWFCNAIEHSCDLRKRREIIGYGN